MASVRSEDCIIYMISMCKSWEELVWRIKSSVNYLLVSEMQSQEEILEVWFNSRTTAVIGVSGRIFQPAKLLENKVGCLWGCELVQWVPDGSKSWHPFVKVKLVWSWRLGWMNSTSKMSLQERVSSVHKWSRFQAICVDKQSSIWKEFQSIGGLYSLYEQKRSQGHFWQAF